ncbi:unnamed protein product [Trifolium pratense]|uniref:Uncharacterized protein n=1 Tax=Trifolium pratense TaxID=57577 RepID=A0ACB0IWQ1_TRIPR|nr:unnamed protein product [Trifolium pratense]
MDLCNTDMIKRYVKELSKPVVKSPAKGRDDGDVHSSSDYSPELGDNGKKLKKTSVLQRTGVDNEVEIDKEMARLKNFGTISLSEEIADATVKAKKRTISRETFVRAETQPKRAKKRVGYFSNAVEEDAIAKAVDDHQTYEAFNSDYRRRVNDKGTTLRSTTAMPRKLSFTPGECSAPPLPGNGRGKQAATAGANGVKRRSPVGRAKGVVAVGKTQAFRNGVGLIIPKIFKCPFKTTVDMKLDNVEVRICAYVFQNDFDVKDIVFRKGKTVFARCEFECMLPGMLVSREDDVVEDDTIDKLHGYYGKDWLPKFDRLNLSKALSKLIDKVYPDYYTFCGLADFGRWDIVEARGVPNLGNSDASGLWVVEWLNMQNSFTSNAIGLVNYLSLVKLLCFEKPNFNSERGITYAFDIIMVYHDMPLSMNK